MKTRIQIVIILLHLTLSLTTAFAAPHSITPWHGNQSAAVSLTFDDAFTSLYTFVLPAINQRGFKGMFFILTGNADYFNSWDSWKEAANTGHEIASHTLTHPYLTTLPSSEAECILEGRIQFPSGAFGGGLGGRVDPSTGAHYGAWGYPDSSVGGSNVLKLVKFRDWTIWNGIPMKQVSLPSAGTGWHNLKMVFNGSQILGVLRRGSQN